MVRIPEEYQEVEYIESTGAQYLELPFGFLDTDEIEVISCIISTGSDQFMIAPLQWETAKHFAMVGGYGSNFTVGFNGQSTAVTYYQILQGGAIKKDTKTHIWTYKNKKFSIIDLNAFYEPSSDHSIKSSTKNLRLFYGYNNPSKGRIYFYNHKKQDGTEINFIPCYRKSDNEIGMYDTVSKTFYTNSGTGTFLKGHNVYYDDVNLLEIRRQMIMYKKDYLKNIEWTQGFFLNGYGFTAHSNAHYSDFIKVTPEKTFILKGYEYQTILYDRIQGYDKEKKFQKMLYRFDWPIGKFSSTIEIPSNCFYIRISTEKSTELHMYDI